MVRMGEEIPTSARSFLSAAVDASDSFAEQLESTFRVEVDPTNVGEVAGRLAEQMRREAFRAANGAKFERELDEKYGVLKDVILHPTVQWLFALCMQLWRSFRVFGEPPLGTTAGVVVALMIYRRKIGFINMALAGAVLSGLNPLIVVVVVALWKLWSRGKHLPKGCRVDANHTTEDVGSDKLSDDFVASKVLRGEDRYDDIVVGSDLGGLYCAALLARCGRRVLVLEQGPLVGAGAIAKAPEGSGNWEFETGVQCLGGGRKLRRFVDRLELACLPGRERVHWDQVGKLESDLAVHDMVSIGDGQQTVVMPAEQEKLLESLMAQFPERRPFFRSFFAQSEKEMTGSLVFYLSRLFPSRPARWLDRVLAAVFLTPGANAHAEIGKRSVSDMLRAMSKAQPDSNDDIEAAQAALCALFRSENLPPQRVSCAVLMGHTSESWGGRFHPRGGFRALAEPLVESILAAGGRVLTRARTTSVLVEEGRAAGVRIAPEASSSGGGVVEVRVASHGRGSVISSIGVIETFRQLVPEAPSITDVAAAGSGGELAGAKAGGRARAAYEPEGFRCLRAARPRVHLCVGLRGNWLEDLDGMGSYYHHLTPKVRRSTMDSTGERMSNGGFNDRHDPGASRDWYRISFGEGMDFAKLREETTTCVVTAEMSDDMMKTVIDGAGSTDAPIGPLHYAVQTGRSARDRLRERLLRRLHREFPLTEGQDEFVMMVEQPRAGLSHGPERYAADGLRAPTKLPGFFLAGEDLTISGMEGALMGGWIAAHASLGYSPADLFLRQRTLATDIPNLDKLNDA